MSKAGVRIILYSRFNIFLYFIFRSTAKEQSGTTSHNTTNAQLLNLNGLVDEIFLGAFLAKMNIQSTVWALQDRMGKTHPLVAKLQTSMTACSQIAGGFRTEHSENFRGQLDN